jgi:hypothetical protein
MLTQVKKWKGKDYGRKSKANSGVVEAVGE